MSMFDEEVSQQVEAVYRTSDAARRRAAVRSALALKPGETVIDIGTGPGFVALEISDEVGPSGQVLGIDNSEPMLSLARRRCADKPQVRFEAGDAAGIPVPDHWFDAAVSVQVFEYVPDVDAAVRELSRVLKRGGRAVVVSSDWTSIVWNHPDQPLMSRVLRAFEEHCPHQDLPRTLAPRLRRAGLRIDDRRVLPQFNGSFDPDTFSMKLIAPIRGFVTGRQRVTAEDAGAWADGFASLADDDAYFFCLNQYLFVVRKPES